MKFDFSINNKIKITNIGPINYLYGVEVDENFIYIPEFLTGNIYRIHRDKKVEVLFIKGKKFVKKFNIKLFNKILFLKKKNKFSKIHDIYLSKNKNFYITSSGDIEKPKDYPSGKVLIFDNKWQFLKQIGLEEKLDFPVMTYLEDSHLFITEYSGNKILIYDKDYKLIDWIGSKITTGQEKSRFKKNFWKLKSGYDGICLNKPHAIKSDDKFYFIVDSFNHRLLRFTKKDKNFSGWVGKSSSGHIVINWKNKIEKTQPSGELGAFNVPIDLQIYKKHLYVSDHAGRIIRINKDTGESINWFGEISSGKIGWHEMNKKYKSNGKNGLGLPYGFRIFDGSIYTSDRNTNTVKIFHDII